MVKQVVTALPALSAQEGGGGEQPEQDACSTEEAGDKPDPREQAKDAQDVRSPDQPRGGI